MMREICKKIVRLLSMTSPPCPVTCSMVTGITYVAPSIKSSVLTTLTWAEVDRASPCGMVTSLFSSVTLEAGTG